MKITHENFADMNHIENELLFKYFRNEASVEEKRRIERWLEEDPLENQKKYRAAHFLFEGIVLYGKTQPQAPVVPLSQGWSLRGVVRYVANAAAILLLVAGAGYVVHTRTYDSLSSQTAMLEAPAGQRVKMTLSDGSQVWLNAGTKLEYPVVFGRDARRVKLSGEAMFEVEHDAKWPFVVETFACDVEVMGTKFNVEADAAAGSFATTLLNGKVKVVALESREVIYMDPDQRVSLINGRLVVDDTPDPNAMLWVDGLLSIKGLSFGELMAKFERAYDVQIVIERPTMPVIEYTSGKIRVSDGIDHALTMLQYASQFTYEKDEVNNVIIIR